MTDTANPLELYSPTTEESLLSALIINPEALNEIEIASNDFYFERSKIIYETLQRLWSNNSLDYITICASLDAAGHLSDFGGPAYITRLISTPANSMMAASYAAIIKDLANRRKVVREASLLVQKASDRTQDLSEALSSSIASIANIETQGQGAVHWGQFLEEADQFIQERQANPSKIWGLETGFAKFDEWTGGLQTKELLILSGEPGIGKSFFILQLAAHLAECNHPGVIYSLEMTGMAVSLRALAMDSKIQSTTFKKGEMTAEDYDVYYKSLEKLHQLPVYMSDKESWTTTGIRADLAKLRRLYGIEWAMIDYSYLLNDGGTNENEKTMIVSKACKGMFKALDIAGVLIHSQTKDGQRNDTPEKVGLRGSGQVSYDADVILFLTHPDKNNTNLIRATFGKGREMVDARKYFDLVRVNGQPRFESVVEKRHIFS